MDDWNRVWSTLEENGKSADVRLYVTVVLFSTKTKYIAFFDCSCQLVWMKNKVGCQIYEVWTQVSFDLSLNFIFFSFLSSSILETGVKAGMTSLSHCHTVTVMVTGHEVAIEGSRKVWKDDIIQHV